jgi:antitoxin component YwqK of YwqJK toxin-antitoxin module
MSISNVSVPVNTFYANGNKEFEFKPSGQGGQAGQYIYYDQNGKKLLSENRSVDGHVGFEQTFNPNGTGFSSTVTAPNGHSSTTVYGAQ